MGNFQLPSFLVTVSTQNPACGWGDRLGSLSVPSQCPVDWMFSLSSTLNLINMGVVQVKHLYYGLEMFEQSFLAYNRAIIRYAPSVIGK